MSSFMHKAVALAFDRLGFSAPNPSVGAVVVYDGEIVGKGCHWACGEPHAEVVALREAGEAANGADLYVTLVPCHHHGRTPPCTQAIIEAGIARVFYACDDYGIDVDTHVSVQELEQAGIHCEKIATPAVDILYETYRYWCQNQKPWVTLKLAQSLDGKIAHSDGRSAKITGPELNLLTHQQRHLHDAILTTAKTIIADNPQLNVRLEDAVISKPLFILDSALQSPLNAQIWQSAASLTFFYDKERADSSQIETFKNKGATCVPLAKNADFLDWQAVLAYTGRAGFHSIWVEAGGTLASELLQHRQVQRAFLYLGQCVLGEQALQGLKPQEVTPVLQSAETEWRKLGRDGMCLYSWEKPCLQD